MAKLGRFSLVKVCLITCCLPFLMGAEVYRWVDNNGVVNFTQLKPRGVQAQQLSTTGGAPRVIAEVADELAGGPADAQAEDSDLSPEQQEMLRELQQAEQARQTEVAKIREANCEKSRSVLERLSASSRIRVRGAGGTERVMGEDERQRRVQEAQRGIAQNCVS